MRLDRTKIRRRDVGGATAEREGESEILDYHEDSEVRPTGFEPVTSGFVDRRSIQLSYGRVVPGAEAPESEIVWNVGRFRAQRIRKRIFRTFERFLAGSFCAGPRGSRVATETRRSRAGPVLSTRA